MFQITRRALTILVTAPLAMPLLAWLSGCSSLLYRPDVVQGNFVSQEMVSRLDVGMSEPQVRSILGTPLIVDTFHNNRWEYVFSLKHGNGSLEQRRLTAYFKDGKLDHLESDVLPSESGTTPGSPAARKPEQVNPSTSAAAPAEPLPVAPELRQGVQAALARWVSSWEQQRSEAQLLLYSPNFQGAEATRQAWEETLRSRFNARGKVEVLLDNVVYTARPNGGVLTVFDRTLKTELLTERVRQALLWRRNAEGEWRIEDEVALPSVAKP